MPYRFTTQEIQLLQAARAQCPAGDESPTTAGNWVPFYTALRTVLGARIGDGTVGGADLQDMRNAKLWLDVAIGANGGSGMHSAFTRAYTNRQGELRLGVPFTEPEMQLASNGVALNLWNDLNGVNGRPPWEVPSIAQIAGRDAASIGVHLFAGRLPGDDTAITANAAWSGALGFNLLGGNAPYESWRLLQGGDGPTVTTSAQFNTLDDIKNILFAVDSYGRALRAGYEQGLSDFVNSFGEQMLFALSQGTQGGSGPSTATISAQFAIANSSGNYRGLVRDVAAFTPGISPAVSLIADTSPAKYPSLAG